jgi:hypothetical protein
MPDERADFEAIIADEDNISDESEKDETPPTVKYAISNYGADPDVESLVKRLRKKEILIPRFQRNYVWSIKEASRLIESLLLGLPVPGIILAKEKKTNKSLVIDGQQRLKSLQFFYDGVFDPKEGSPTQKVFKLVDVQPRFLGRTYATLEEADRIQLDNSIIHATVIKQESPPNDDTSIHHVFERLNSGGRKLVPQEIRAAVSHGSFIDLLKNLNKDAKWRSIYGKPSPRLKDQELILRFFALFHDSGRYEKPFAEFLNKYIERHRNPTSHEAATFRTLFENTISSVHAAIGTKAFRPVSSLNAAVYDSVMVGVAKRLSKKAIKSPNQLKKAYEKLLNSNKYIDLISRATSDEQNVSSRLKLAIEAFARVE